MVYTVMYTMGAASLYRQKTVVTRIIICGLFVTCIFLSHPIAAAQQSSDVIAQNYSANSEASNLVAGAIVANVPNKSGFIDLATIDSVERLVGVVDTSPLVSLSSGDKKVPVVLAGTTTALVSDLNGSIKSGDKITVSPIAGVGMLALSDTHIIGTAQADFDKNSSVTREITDDEGNTHTVHIQKLPLHVGVTSYSAPNDTFLPPFIQDIANGIAGKPVSLIRILICAAILTISFAYTVVMMYASTRSTITALGRNPLGTKEIRKGLYNAILIAFAIVGSSLLAAYLLLVL